MDSWQCHLLLAELLNNLIDNGWFVGFLPTVAFAMVAATSNIYQGLWCSIVIASITLVIGVLFVRETKENDLNA